MVNATNIIIDCDAGTDDALALYILLTAHKLKKLKIEAVTCVFGNTCIENVVKNVFRVVELFDDHNIPIYQGAYSSLTSGKGFVLTGEYYHGADGFGDVLTDEPNTSKMNTAHAAYALNKYTSDMPGVVSIVCLGPLTNIALAIKLYPDFASNIKDLYIMGGNSTGRGNITSQAEFNFYCDPESASIVLNNISKPIYLLPWESCLKSRITYDWRVNILGKVNTPFVQMLNNIEDGCERRRKNKKPQHYVTCDAILAGIILRPEMAKNMYTCHVDVELTGNRTRGQVVIDHQQINETNVHLIDDFDSEMFKELLLNVTKPCHDDKLILPSRASANVDAGS